MDSSERTALTVECKVHIQSLSSGVPDIASVYTRCVWEIVTIIFISFHSDTSSISLPTWVSWNSQIVEVTRVRISIGICEWTNTTGSWIWAAVKIKSWTATAGTRVHIYVCIVWLRCLPSCITIAATRNINSSTYMVCQGYYNEQTFQPSSTCQIYAFV